MTQSLLFNGISVQFEARGGWQSIQDSSCHPGGSPPPFYHPRVSALLLPTYRRFRCLSLQVKLASEILFSAILTCNPTNTVDQLFPPAPEFSGKGLLDLSGKVYLISGGNTGIGFELAKILYARGGIATRNEKKAVEAITVIKSAFKTSNGTVKFLALDLSDLLSVKTAAEDFLRKEKRLDVLFNNAGVTHPGVGGKTNQGYEMTMGANCLGPFLLTSLLVPILRSTAKSGATGSVRVVFSASGAVEMSLNPYSGMDFAVLQRSPFLKSNEQQQNYRISKSGNWLLAAEVDRHLRSDGIVSVQNPGNLKNKDLGHDTMV